MNTPTTPAQDAGHRPNIDALRGHLMDTLAALRDRANPMDVDRARAVAQVATVLVETAKVEVDYLRVTHQMAAPFFKPTEPAALPAPAANTSHWPQGEITREPGRTRHRMGE